jgi:hypothetical protein
MFNQRPNITIQTTNACIEYLEARRIANAKKAVWMALEAEEMAYVDEQIRLSKLYTRPSSIVGDVEIMAGL